MFTKLAVGCIPSRGSAYRLTVGAASVYSLYCVGRPCSYTELYGTLDYKVDEKAFVILKFAANSLSCAPSCLQMYHTIIQLPFSGMRCRY
jgi:hypothetical protein